MKNQKKKVNKWQAETDKAYEQLLYEWVLRAFAIIF
jgi:hypothetical protein